MAFTITSVISKLSFIASRCATADKSSGTMKTDLRISDAHWQRIMSPFSGSQNLTPITLKKSENPTKVRNASRIE
jgi:hypothetical protein